MDTKYQLITIGAHNSLRSNIIETFIKRVEELGLSKDRVSIIDALNFNTVYERRGPSVCIYFGNRGALSFSDTEKIDELHSDALFIIPVVTDLNHVTASVPSTLHPINAFQLASATDVDALVNRLLEGLSLLRQVRRLFISYKRDEASTLAAQVYEHLDACGYDVFLDTHSILAGSPFQEELWHRLVDTDVVVLINSPNFFKSKWTTQELAQASAMSIGVVQLVFPEVEPDEYAALCDPIYLTEDQFENRDYKISTPRLTTLALKEVARHVEVSRARNLASRQDGMIQEFVAAASEKKLKTYLQSEKVLTIENQTGEKIDVIPTVGVPEAFTFNQGEDLIKRIRQSHTPKTYLLYDHRNILEKWLVHLGWLDLHLPVKAIKVTELDQWMNKL